MKDFLFILWCFYSTVSYSQNEEINNILTSKGDIKLPTSVPKLNSAFGVNPNIEEDDIHGNLYMWNLINGVVLSTIPENNNIRWLNIKVKGNQIINGMPYGLILNKTTLESSMTQFNMYSPQKIQLYEDGKPNGFWVKFKKGNQFIYLTFKSLLLREILVANFEIDMAS